MARPTPEQQFSLARHDVDLVFLDELTKQGYARPTTGELVRVGLTGVDLRYLREMAALGYRLGTLDALVRLSNHSIGPSLIREMNARAGRQLSAEELMEQRNRGSTTATRSTSTPLDGRWTIHRTQGANADLELFWSDDTNWRRWIASSAFRGVSGNDILSPTSAPVAFRIEQDAGSFAFEGTFRGGRGSGDFRFRPNRPFASTLRSLGLRDVGEVTDHQLKNLAYGGVGAAEIREYQALGFAPLTLENAIDLAIFRVTPDYIRAMQSLGVSDANTVRGAIDLRHQGVTPEFVQKVREAGYRDVPTRTLIQMRRRGIDEIARRDGLRREP